MLTAAALVPDTALLVPGVGGRTDALVVGLREAALAAVAEVLSSRPGRVAVVAPAVRPRTITGPVRASLAGAGVPDAMLGWVVPGPRDAPVPAVASAVAVHLLARCGAGSPDEVVEVTGSTSAEDLHRLGAALAADGPTVLVVVGSLSARHGPDAPLADDPRAPALDSACARDLADPTPAARARLAAVEPEQAAALAVTGWAPWQVLVGAADGTHVQGRLLARADPAGAAHGVFTWRTTGVAA
ncbi:MAG: hypothetical protein HGA44_20005 [Cellulomonadaceae bacterium]|nr:hypothetical protein [Cellulomonadaceae bacterium]